MAVKSKVGASASKREVKVNPPKRTRQGQGSHSKPNHGRKQMCGQGR